MKVIICPGVHDPQLSDRFLSSLFDLKKDATASEWQNQFLTFPTAKYPAYSAYHLYCWLKLQNPAREELFFIAFSAGVVAAIGAIAALKLQKIQTSGLVAIDGWGVPLWGKFPIYRFSHDYFTHWSSALLGTGQTGFYSDPAVEHLAMWHSPENCGGWITQPNSSPRKSTVKDYLQEIIKTAQSQNRVHLSSIELLTAKDSQLTK